MVNINIYMYTLTAKQHNNRCFKKTGCVKRKAFLINGWGTEDFYKEKLCDKDTGPLLKATEEVQLQNWENVYELLGIMRIAKFDEWLAETGLEKCGCAKY